MQISPHTMCKAHMPQDLGSSPSTELLGLYLHSTSFIKKYDIALLMFSEKQTALQIVTIKLKQENEKVFYIKVPDTCHCNGH